MFMNKMKEKVTYKSGSFTDYAGLERKFTFAAVSFTGNHPITGDKIGNLLLGLSVVHPSDMEKVSDEIGKTIAKNKAMHPKTTIGVVGANYPMMSAGVVDAILEQEVERFKQNPGNYIAGYKNDKIKYNLSKNGGDKIAAKMEKMEKEYAKLQGELKELQIQASK